MENMTVFLALKPALQEKLKSDGIEKFLDFLGNEKLSRKKQRMKNLLKIAQHDEALYREIMLALGYKNNKVQFLKLALILPYSQICKLKNKNIIEQALLYRAGLSDKKDLLPEDFDFSLRMEKSVWNYKGIIPANFPERRIKGISGFLAESCKNGLCESFKQEIEKNYTQEVSKREAEKIVNKIISFEGAGKTRRLEIFFNIVLPFFQVIFENEGKCELVKFLDDLYSHHPPLADNSITKLMKKQLFNDKSDSSVINSVNRYMGLIQFYNEVKEVQNGSNT